MQKPSVLLLASQGAEAERVAAFCRMAFGAVEAYHGDWGHALPDGAGRWEGDIIVSYCSRWIVPKALLDRARIAINFHPAPPTYPGTGGLNWALYENSPTFGVTCHHMIPAVDAGPIVETRRFQVLPGDDVASLFARTHLHLEVLACDVLAALADAQPLPAASETWASKTRKRAELDAMMAVPQGAPADEIARRERAFVFGKWRLRMAAD